MNRSTSSLAGRARAGIISSMLLISAVAVSACQEEIPPSGKPRPTLSPTAAAPTTVPRTTDVWLINQSESGTPADVVQNGSAEVDVTISVHSGGELGSRASGPGSGNAFRFPRFVQRGTYPRAVVVVTERQAGDLDPGRGDFSFGTDFILDQDSTSRTEDNGNNLVQRGISSDTSMYKLEVDANHRPSCTVRGTDGEVVARSVVEIIPNQWYRAQCLREGDDLTVLIGTVDTDGGWIPSARTQSGIVGRVQADHTSVPLSIGGKVARTGEVIASDTDQFNGSMRNSFLDLSPDQ